MQLNPQQQEAVNHTEGPLLIIAGAGSGKTRVLTERLAKILEDGLATPEEILAVTFTNKAAGEIKERVLSRLEGTGINNLPWIGTFHSIAVRILRREAQHLGINNQFTIFDSDDQLKVIKESMEELEISTRNLNPKAALGMISKAKNELITPKDFALSAAGNFEENVAEIYTLYQKKLKTNMAMDFDDLLMNLVVLLQDNDKVRDRYQQLFKYVMVDEYQDTNHAQYMIVSLLAPPQNNIAVVGDDDQSIYGWRGANIRNILEFEQDFGDVKVIRLEQNYRSTQKILDAGNKVVSKISNRKAKTLWTENPVGENLSLYEALDEKDEAYWIGSKIETLVNGGTNPADIVVLYRINAQSRVLEEILIQGGIPYKIVGNVRFYERKEIKDILAYLRVIYNHNDIVSLLRIINTPARKIGNKTVEELLVQAQNASLSPTEFLINNSEKLTGPLIKFAQLLRDFDKFLENHDLLQLIDYVAEHSGYAAMLDDGTEEGAQRLENVKELSSIAAKYEGEDVKESLQQFLEEIALIENTDEKRGTTNSNEEAEADRVTLMTAHGAKGLEFDHVFIMGMEEGIFPHSRSFNSIDEMEEERRLAYVAITRAKQKVYITYTLGRMFFGFRQSAIPSRFLQDIDTAIIDFETYTSGYDSQDNFKPYASKQHRGNQKNNVSVNRENNRSDVVFNVKPGDSVQHQKFGHGRVVSIDMDVVVVDFDNGGSKELSTEFAGLVKIS